MSSTMRIGVLLLCILTADTTGWARGSPKDLKLRIENRTGYEVVKLYIAPTSRPAWGKNLLERGALRNTESIQVVISRLAAWERFFDIMAVDTDGDRYLQSGIDLLQDSTIVLRYKDFLEPSKEGWDWEEYYEGYGDEVATNSGQR